MILRIVILLIRDAGVGKKPKGGNKRSSTKYWGWATMSMTPHAIGICLQLRPDLT